VIGQDGVKPDEKRIEAVKEYPRPKTTRELKGFLGLAGYYRRFIPNFSKVAKPLTELLKKNAPYVWDDKMEEAFISLKTSLITEPLLQYPDFSRPFVLTTDASNEAIGAVLSQGPIGKDPPVAYASRTLTKAEKGYPTIELELLAIIWGCKYFRQYLYGRKFTIVTDHRPLTWIFNVKDPSSRLLRWRLLLEVYQYEVTYKKGSHNTNVDALSRIHVTEGCTDSLDDNSKLTEEEKQAVFREMHDKPIGGHLGMNRTYDRQTFYHLARHEARVIRVHTTMRDLPKEQDYAKQNQNALENYNHSQSSLGEVCSRYCWSLKSNFRWK